MIEKYDPTLKLTEAQKIGLETLAKGLYSMLFGGSRSGKTFLIVFAIVFRALAAPFSRHVVFRFRLKSVKNAVFLDTFPSVMRKCFPTIDYDTNASDLYVTLSNGSEIWFCGLDDKARTEKILGMEFVTLYFNESSELQWGSIKIAITRLAQKVESVMSKDLHPRIWFDCNPPRKSHWSYTLFIKKLDPETRNPVRNPDDYNSFKMNPSDNTVGINDAYLGILDGYTGADRKRFLDGEFGEDNPNALFPEEHIERNRIFADDPPDMLRIVVAVDPSGAGDENNEGNDAIGIVVAGLGTDGRVYVLEDLTVKAGPATWGRVAVTAFERHRASAICGETNFGGAMVEQVIKIAAKEQGVQVVFKMVHASRGKVQRAEPVGQLYCEDRVVHCERFRDLEEELGNFSTHGYVGKKSPNRADALVWAISSLFPGITRREVKPVAVPIRRRTLLPSGGQTWMGS